MKSKYDSQYQKHQEYFGGKPEKILVEYADLIDRSGSVVDIGAGQGRNSFFLAETGFNVIAVDNSETACEILRGATKKYSKQFTVEQTDVKNYFWKGGLCSAVLLFGIFQEMPIGEIRNLISTISGWLAEGGYVFVTAFTDNDPSFSRYSAESNETDGPSLILKEGACRTFFRQDELMDIFSAYHPAHYREYLGKMHSHGGGESHKHGMVEGVFTKQSG